MSPVTMVESPPHFEFPDPYTGSMLVMDGAAPLHPPAAWFSQEAADEAPDKLRVFPGGRVAGVVAPQGRCLLKPGTDCWMVPRPTSPEDYDLAHTGFTATAEGDTIRTGVLAGGGGHANEFAGVNVAQRHYADTNTQLMRGRYHWSDQAGGLCFVGAVWPDVTPRQIAEINASPASIDFRWIEDEQRHRLVGACLVNIGGLPTRWRATMTAAAVIIEPERPPAFVAALGQSDSIMLALGIDAPQFALGMPVEQLHMTLGMFGDMVNVPDEVRAAASEAIANAVVAYGAPMILTASSVGIMGPPGEEVTALLMQGDDLVAFREVMVGVAEMAGLVADDSYPVFTPHITVGPYDQKTVDAALALRGTIVNPPSVVLAFGSEQWFTYELPSTGQPLEVVTLVGEDLAETAAVCEPLDILRCSDCGTELCSDCGSHF